MMDLVKGVPRWARLLGSMDLGLSLGVKYLVYICWIGYA